MCTQCDFVHLHLHTEYSLLDGFARIDKAVQYAQKLGMPALGITDHGTMFGVIDFYRACKAAEITPVIGVEAYITEDHTLKSGDANKPHHLLLFAENMKGYQNLMQLSSIAQLDGFYYRPRIDKTLLARYSEGLIGTTGCLAAEVPKLFEKGQESEAERMIGEYQDIFGVGNFYAELQGHDIPELHALNQWLIPTAKRLNVPLLATNDVHYVRASDVEAHDTLLCIQTSTVKSAAKRMRMEGKSYYMRTQQEMWDLFGHEADSLLNTLVIAERCQGLDLERSAYHLPVFPVPAHFKDAASYLEHLCQRGLKWRYGADAERSLYVERLKHELNIINTMGFATYFLIVWDLCQFAEATDIWWNVRGSGAGSMVAYVLGITNLDPIENGLIFERFLNPGRVSMPDFDLDFPEDRRMEMIDYCCRKYGWNKVAAIITFGTLGAKGAIKDVGRALSVELSEVDKITRVIPTNPALPPLKDLISDDTDKAIQELRDMYLHNPTAKSIIDTAIDLEGMPRHASTHAAGIIVADKPLVEYIPLHRPTKGNAEDSPVKMVTQFPMETAESLGLLKIDFLGLSTLTILRRACDLIEKHHQIKYNMGNIPIKPDPNNPKVTQLVEEMFEMIGRGDTIGVFQIESSGMRQMLTGMQPKTFEHIIAAISLYRPGPMEYIPEFNARMHGDTEVIYHHEKLKPILGNTYGICVYQEQIMQIGADLFGYSLGEADLMRRAVSKKKDKDLMLHRKTFVERGPENGVDAETANKIFNDIEFFARYGFNKSHAADYAVITCQTAFLKCHYPHEYMTALMSVYFDNSAKVSVFIQECRRLGIEVLPPDVNYSVQDFDIQISPTTGQSAIRFGFGAIKNVGENTILHILAERENGLFEDLDDFIKRCNMKDVGKRALESLIRVGALESLTLTYPEFDRAYLLKNLENLMAFSVNHHKNAAAGQSSMFDLMGTGSNNAGSVLSVLTEIPPKDWTPREQLRWERDLMGLYISRHPLDALSHLISAQTHITTIADIKEENENGLPEDKKFVRLLALISGIRLVSTKHHQTMAILTVEDQHGTLEVVVFPKIWEDFKAKVEVDASMVIYGKVELRGGELQILADRLLTTVQVTEALERETYITAPPEYEEVYSDTPKSNTPIPEFVGSMSPSYEATPQVTAALAPAPIPPLIVASQADYPITLFNPFRLGEYVEPLPQAITKRPRRLVIQVRKDLNLSEKSILEGVERLMGMVIEHYHDCADYLRVLYTVGNEDKVLNFRSRPFAMELVDIDYIQQHPIVLKAYIEEDD